MPSFTNHRPELLRRIRHGRKLIFGRIRRGLKPIFTNSRIAARARPRKEFGLAGLDTKVIEKINQRKGFYVEIGANNGLDQSNTLALELYWGWSGVLVEPIPSTFKELKRLRNGRRNYLVQSACVGADWEEKTMQIAFANLMSTPLGVDSDISHPMAHAESGRKFLGKKLSQLPVTVLEVPAVTMTSILKKSRAPQEIDFLSLDVEGGELEVLRGIDFELYTIRWILVESRDAERIRKYLEPFGYVLDSQLSVHDYLFFLPN